MLIEWETRKNGFIWFNWWLFRFFFNLHLLLNFRIWSLRDTTFIVGQIKFWFAVRVTLSKLKVLNFINNLVLSINQSFKLFISSSDFVLQRGNNFFSLVLNALFEFCKLDFNVLETAPKFWEQNFCLLSDHSIDRGLNAGHGLWK